MDPKAASLQLLFVTCFVQRQSQGSYDSIQLVSTEILLETSLQAIGIVISMDVENDRYCYPLI